MKIKIDKYLILSFISGLIPASFIIHIIPTDFSGFYFQAISYLKFHSPAFQHIENYCNNPLNTGLNARAPIVPLLLAITIGLLGKNLLAIYLPFFIARIAIPPLTYLIGRFYLPKKLAFMSSLLLVFIPKLQTYSFGTFEADVFVAFFYLSAFYFYLKSNNLINKNYTLISAISLALGTLCKSTGLSISLGFIMAIILMNIRKCKNRKILMNLITYVLFYIIIVTPYFIWTLHLDQQVYLTNHQDKSFFYIPTNLPSLISTIPLYLGINFSLGLKAKIIALLLLGVFVIGIIKSLIKKDFLLTFPTITSILLISTVSTCLLGGNIPASLEFITLLGFTMIPASILLFIGFSFIINFIFKHSKNMNIPNILIFGFLLLIFIKFINNYFTSPYSLNYISGQYYISLPTIIKNQSPLPEVNFKKDKGLILYTGPIIHREIRKQFNNFRFEPFSPIYKITLLSFTFISMIIVLDDKSSFKGKD